jgi:membrane fusion protein
VLFVLSAERLTDQHGAIGGAQSVILEQLGRRRASLSEEAARQSDVTAAQLAAAARRLSDLEAESAQIGAEVSTQAARVASVRVQVQRFEELRQHEFMSELAAQVKREDLLDQLARLQSLERSRLVVAREAAALAAELKQIPLRGAQQQAELRRAAAAIEQEIAATEASRQIVVTAPHDGTITAILVDRGQTVQSGPLATLLPADTPLEAHLYVSSRAAGFVEPGQSVRIRYAAYPYQKFGQYGGRVRNVSRSALAANELPPLLAALGQQGEGLYRIAVRLDSPDVVVYGKPQPLTAGMQLDADVLQERRRLIEWVFEPLYSLRGKF